MRVCAQRTHARRRRAGGAPPASVGQPIQFVYTSICIPSFNAIHHHPSHRNATFPMIPWRIAIDSLEVPQDSSTIICPTLLFLGCPTLSRRQQRATGGRGDRGQHPRAQKYRRRKLWLSPKGSGVAWNRNASSTSMCLFLATAPASSFLAQHPPLLSGSALTCPPSLGSTRPLKPLRPWRTPWTDTEAGTGHRIMDESRRPEAGWDYGQIQKA